MSSLKNASLICFGMLSALLHVRVFGAVGLSIQELQSPQEQEITARARSRSYPGGRDEEPLKVQTKVVATETEEESTDANVNTEGGGDD